MSNLSPDSTFIDKTSIVVAFLITVGLAVLYFVCTGIVANWPDSLFYADRARQLLEDGRLALNAETTLSYPPLYSMLMALSFYIGSFSVGAFFVPSFLLSHQILVCLQIALLCSTFFPIRRLLLGCDGIGKNEATVLSVIIALSPTALPYANMLSAEALFIPLFVWFTYFYDKFLNANKASEATRYAMGAGALLGLLLITKDIAWAAYVAVLLNTLWVILKKQPVK